MITLSRPEVEALERAALAVGDTRVRMTRTQITADRRIAKMNGRTFYTDCSRRWGKTRFAALKSFNKAIQRPESIIRYGAPTKTHGRQFVEPAFAWASTLVPEKLRPKFDRQANTWHWNNGSVCHLGSMETMADVEAQVGTDCHLAIADEVAKARSDMFRHWHRSVVLPQFLTTDGYVLVATTPAINQGHYCAELARSCMARGDYVRFTIDDCDHISRDAMQDVIREIIAPDSIAWEPWMEAAAKSHPDILRELYCQHISDPSRMIVPEWQQVAEDCVREVERPSYLDWYCAADFGFSDLTVVLWGFYDFERARLVVTHEVAMHRESGLAVGERAREVEREIGAQRVFRVADAPPQMLADLVHPSQGPGIQFSPALKDDAEAALNKLRMLVHQKRIVVDPRCKTLISHLHNGTWNANRTSFERVEGYGHWDAIDALKYMVRVINWTRNPAPVIAPGTNYVDTYIRHNATHQPRARKILNPRSHA